MKRERSDAYHPDDEGDQVKAVDNGVGEESALFGDVGLMAVGEHMEGEVEVESPGGTYEKEEEIVIGL